MRLLLAEERDASAAALRIEQAGAWNESVRVAHAWGVLPRLGERIESTGSRQSAELRREISRLIADGYVRSVLAAQQGLEVLACFDAAGLPAAGFKGLASMAALYADPKQRVILDVDVLIREEDLPHAAKILGSLGLRPVVKASLADYVNFVRHSPGFAGNEELAFQNDRGNTIDLHWLLGAGFDPRAILSRIRCATLFGQKFPAVSPQDGLLLCVHHSLRNHFNPDKLVRDLLDLEGWCAEVERSDEVNAIVLAAANNGLAVPWLASSRILADFYRNGAVARLASQLEQTVSPQQRRSAERLCALFRTQLHEGQFQEDLLYLFQPGDLKRILGGLFSGGTRYLKIAESMDTALTGAPVPRRQRLAAVFRSLLRVRPYHFGMLRTLARAKADFGKQGSRKMQNRRSS
jgi:hypothetical protein